MQTNSFGFLQQEWQEMLDVFKKYQDIEKVVLFGSRAKNTFKTASDVDITIYGDNVNHSLIASLQSDFEDSSIPYFYDILNYKTINSDELKEHIRRYGKVIYEKGRNEWVETTLGEVVKIMYGKDHKKLKDGQYPLYGSGGIMRYVESFLYNKESILIPRKGTLSNLFFIDKPFWTVDTLFYTKIDTSKTLPKFLFYKLKIMNLESLNVGSAVPSLTTNVLNDVILNLPPLPEQKAIASILSSFDDKIELLREQNKTLENISQNIFKEWFVNFNFPGANGKMIDSELGKIPKEWRVGKLGDLNSHLKDNIKPYQNPDNLFAHYSLPDFDQGEKPNTTESNLILSNKYKVHSMSFLVSKLNPKTPRIWMIFKPDDNGICSTEFQVIKPNDLKVFAYVYSILRSESFINELFSKAKGTSSSHQRVSPQDILDAKIIISDDITMNEYQNLIFPMLEKIDKNKYQIQNLSNIRDILLPKLMCREVEVNFEK